MAGKTTTKASVKKEKPVIDMSYIDDMILRLESAENSITSAGRDIDIVLNAMNGLERRVEKVEARLGIG